MLDAAVERLRNSLFTQAPVTAPLGAHIRHRKSLVLALLLAALVVLFGVPIIRGGSTRTTVRRMVDTRDDSVGRGLRLRLRLRPRLRLWLRMRLRLWVRGRLQARDGAVACMCGKTKLHG